MARRRRSATSALANERAVAFVRTSPTDPYGVEVVR
jgi:hypothetical protein